MPYQSKADREKAEWITLADAVLHVVSADGIRLPSTIQSEPVKERENGPLDFPFMDWDFGQTRDHDNDPLSQIRWALHDGEIPLRWMQEPWPVGSSFHPYTMFDPQLPPPSGPFWLYAEIFPSEDYAVNQVDQLLSVREYVSKRRLRRLFLLRSRVLELWPSRTTRPGRAGEPRLTTEQYEQLVREAARELYKRGQPNQMEAEQILQKQLGIPRKLVRPVLQEDEFASHRRPRGNSSKRSKR